MKPRQWMSTALIALAMVGIAHLYQLKAQTVTSIGFTTASALSGCAVNATNTYCTFGTAASPGLAISVAGGVFVQVYPSAVSAPVLAVTSFNGRTGAVTSQTGDYSFAQLTSPPSTISCAAFSVSNSTGLSCPSAIIK